MNPTARLPARPLLRGILTDLGRWSDDSSRPGWQRRWATISVWCPWCARWHYHGWDPADDARHIEHRCSHCGDGSPLRETGYWISTVRKGDPGYESHVVRPGVKIERLKPETRRAAS